MDWKASRRLARKINFLTNESPPSGGDSVCVENCCEHTPQQTACVFVGVEIYFIGGVNPASQSSFARAKFDA
jgi:hypothetical protein